MRLENRLRDMLQGDADFTAMLSAARRAGLPDWHVGAGVVRDLVWDRLSGRTTRPCPRDVDLVYFDPDDLSEEAEAMQSARLCRLAPGYPWDAVNQARVHLWYPPADGRAVPPFLSVHDAVASWPEFATCVAVRLEADGRIGILAPHGLDDLFALRVRWNPARVTADTYRRRLQEKDFVARWQGVQVVRPDP